MFKFSFSAFEFGQKVASQTKRAGEEEDGQLSPDALAGMGHVSSMLGKAPASGYAPTPLKRQPLAINIPGPDTKVPPLPSRGKTALPMPANLGRTAPVQRPPLSK